MKNSYSIMKGFVVLLLLAFTTPTIGQQQQNADQNNTLGFYTDPHYVFLNALFQNIVSEAPLTVFLPTPHAFNNLTQEQKDFYFQHPYTELIDLLKGHMVSGVFKSNDLSDDTELEAINGNLLAISHKGHNIYVNDSKIVRANTHFARSIIHSIDQVIIPETTVYSIIKNSKDHNILEAAIKAAELDGALMAEGQFTVFAPTDEAFGKLPEGTVDELLEDPKGELAQILLYHVAGSKSLSTDLSNTQVIETLQGKEVSIDKFKGDIFINNAKIIIKDIVTSNGVVHVINAVLIPPVNTSVDDSFGKTSFVVSPNPALNNVKINFDTNIYNSIKFVVYDSTGKIVKQKDDYSSNEFFEVSSLNKGIYFIVITTNGTKTTQKLIIR